MTTDNTSGKDFRTTKRRWIKLYPSESLNGSIRYQLSSAERGMWYDLLCFASLCSNTGDICDRSGEPYPLSYIANRLNVKVSVLEETIRKCLAEGRITQDDNGLHITNWLKYQSEYDRQKPYREAKKAGTTQAGDILNPELADLVTLCEQNFKYTLTPIMLDEVERLYNEHGAAAVGEAIKTAALNGKNNLAYVRGILDNPDKGNHKGRKNDDNYIPPTASLYDVK